MMTACANFWRRRSPMPERLTSRDDRPASLSRAERELTERHAVGCRAIPAQVGHRTVGRRRHRISRPDGAAQARCGLTVQLGLGEHLANVTRCPVIYDLRAADVAAGGQGAPLVPVYHRALTAKLPARPLAIVNVGGVANVTWIGRDGDLLAFDTRPGQCASR